MQKNLNRAASLNNILFEIHEGKQQDGQEGYGVPDRNCWKG